MPPVQIYPDILHSKPFCNRARRPASQERANTVSPSLLPARIQGSMSRSGNMAKCSSILYVFVLTSHTSRLRRNSWAKSAKLSLTSVMPFRSWVLFIFSNCFTYFLPYPPIFSFLAYIITPLLPIVNIFSKKCFFNFYKKTTNICLFCLTYRKEWCIMHL